MDILIIVKCLFFLEGLLLLKFSPRLLVESARPFVSSILEYGLGYMLSFGWIWYADQSRRIAPTLITCILLSMTVKWYLKTLLPVYINEFLHVLCTSMIIPLTCSFTMMQCNPRQERESWSFQYSFLLMGRLARTLIPQNFLHQNELLFDFVLSSTFVVVAGLIPWIQRRNLVAQSLDPMKKPVQIYTPISGLIDQFRYLYFLLSVLCASFFFYFTRKTILDASNTLPAPWILLCVEILTCWAAYLLCPHRIPPQHLFLVAQILIATRFLIFSLDSTWIVLVETISVIGFVAFSVANAQIVATHGKPGLEYTTCALVDITRNGLGPIVFVLLRPYFKSINVALIGCAAFTLGFAGKYYFVDYPHDKLIKKKV